MAALLQMPCRHDIRRRGHSFIYLTYIHDEQDALRGSARRDYECQALRILRRHFYRRQNTLMSRDKMELPSAY